MHLQWEKEALTPEAFTKEGPLFHSASPLPPPHAFQGPRRGRCSRFSINFFLRLSVKMLLLSWRMVRLWGGCTKEGFDVNVTVTRAFLIDEFLHVFFFFFFNLSHKLKQTHSWRWGRYYSNSYYFHFMPDSIKKQFPWSPMLNFEFIFPTQTAWRSVYMLCY